MLERSRGYGHAFSRQIPEHEGGVEAESLNSELYNADIYSDALA